MFFFFNDTATTEIYTLSLHDALPIYGDILWRRIEKGAENLLTDPDKTVTCWCAEPSGSSFPLFSQKATWGSTLQVHAAKRFVVVSTDSQASSQQQGLFIWFRREPLASESCSCAY